MGLSQSAISMMEMMSLPRAMSSPLRRVLILKVIGLSLCAVHNSEMISSKPGSPVSYPSILDILDFAPHIQSLMPDFTGSGSFSLLALTQEDLVLRLKAEIVACYNDDPGLISLDKLVGNELSFMM